MKTRWTGIADRSLRVVQWSSLLAAMWLFGRALAFPSPLPVPRLEVPAAEPPADRDLAKPASLEDLSRIWEHDLRQVLIPPKAPPRPEPPRARPEPPVRLPKLLATFVENGRCWAVFQDARGAHRVLAESAEIDDLTIRRIVPGGVTLMRAGKQYELSVPHPKIPARRSSRRR